MADNLQSILGEPLDLPGGEGSPHGGRSNRRTSLVKIILIVVTGLILIGGLGYGGWRYYKSRHKTTPPPQQATTQNTTPPADSGNDVPAVTELKTFTSDTLNLQISYPAGWTPSEKDGGLTIVSPAFTYQTIDKGSVNGNFRVYIRQGARAVDGKYIGQGVAIKPSEQLAYAKPGTSQRKTTAFTNFGSFTSDHFTFFMVTGDYSLQKEGQLGPTYGHEPETFIIVGGYSTPDHTDDLAFNNVSLDQYSAKRAYTQAVDIVKSLQIK